MKLSITKLLCVTPTPRQNPVFKAGSSWRTYSTRIAGDVVEQLRRSVHPVDVDPVLESGRQIAGDDRRADDPVHPCDRLALRIQRRRHTVVVVRPIDVVLDVLLACPD